MSGFSLRFLMMVLAVAALSGCGGGGGSGGASGGSTSASAVSDEVAVNAKAQDKPATITLNGAEVEEYQAAMLEYVNAARSQARNCGSERFDAAPPLQYNGVIQGAADEHTQDMATNNFFSHTGSDGLRVGGRVTKTGYAWSVVGENIAAGYDSVKAVMDAWVASPGHCANIMDPRFTEFAVKRMDATGADYPNYWTQVFAEAR
ncbi:CAP domain-containing protein [Marinobacter sp. C2H3]|uniref:CAP domain-containing protein n=1 Tax=Marinobacter sp. C2H3 TaxID=3119003 RepID=UPI00300ECD11